MAQGGEFGGWSLYLLDGKPGDCSNTFGIHHAYADSEQTVPSPPGSCHGRSVRRI